MARGSVSDLTARVLLGIAACWGAAPQAQPNERVSAPVRGERLSDWLLRQPKDPRAYPPGLHWQVPSERYAQAGIKRELLTRLKISESPPPATLENLARLIQALPVTGRVPIPLTDPRWLQAHPKDDPLLQYDHVVALPHRPATVSVITNAGAKCTLPHRLGGEARDYLTACEPENIDRIDFAWVVQPDGTVSHWGIGRWNAQSQDEVAPGALIWAPTRAAGWSPNFSALLTEFLATQSYDAIVATEAPTGIAPRPLVMQRDPARDAIATANDWGLIGLLQTPTARMAPAGEARYHYSTIYPYERNSVLLQPLDWLEAGFRYTNVRNRLYGSTELSGDQTYKDKSFDFKAMLLKETARLPQIAVGFTDVGGTGLFSSEYLVANKRSGNFDWSLGVGWGYMAGSGNIPNPLSLLGGKRFDTRAASTNPSGGTVNSASLFHGNTSLFGGVQYHTASDKWLLKLEYDGNNYQREPQANNQHQKTPINAGLVYRYSPGVDFTVGLERGNTLMLGLTLHAALNKLHAPKVSDAPTPRVVAHRPTAEPIWAATADDIVSMTGWSVRQISRKDGTLQVVINGAYGTHWNDRIERMAAVLHRDAPSEINEFNLVFVEQGNPMTGRLILREPWVKQYVQRQAMSDRFHAIAAGEPRSTFSATSPVTSLWENSQPRFGYSIIPTVQQNLGGPDAFLLWRAGVSVPLRLKLSESLSITGAASLGLIDNFKKFKYTGPSNLPRVRTHLREYMSQPGVTVPNLQLTHMGSMGRNQYYSLYGGLLESMFGGVGGEWLYRPLHSPLAFGIDINRVKQRNFKQDFEFDNAGGQTGYRVTTGHATTYWDTGWNSTHVNLSVGQYLAGDSGATLDISRTFNNGISMGAWATKTNVSAEQFGEGSFDKGIYLKIPFDVMMTSRSPGVANLVYSPLTRDGGARLNRNFNLYDATNLRGARHTSYVPAGTKSGDDGPR